MFFTDDLRLKIQYIMLRELEHLAASPGHKTSKGGVSKSISVPSRVHARQVRDIIQKVAVEFANLLNESTDTTDPESGTQENNEGILRQASTNQQRFLSIDTFLEHLSSVACDLECGYHTDALLVIYALLLGEHKTLLQEMLVHVGCIAGLADVQKQMCAVDPLGELGQYVMMRKCVLLHIMCDYCENQESRYLLLGERSLQSITLTNMNVTVSDRVQLRMDSDLCRQNGSRELLPALLGALTDPQDLCEPDIWQLMVRLMVAFGVHPCDKMFIMEQLCSTEHVLCTLTDNYYTNTHILEHGMRLLAHLTDENHYAIQELSSYVAHKYLENTVGEIHLRMSKFMDIIEHEVLVSRQFIENLFLLSERAIPTYPTQLSLHEGDPRVIQHMVSDEAGYMSKYVVGQQVLYLCVMVFLLARQGQRVTERDELVRLAVTICLKAHERGRLAECIGEMARQCRTRVYRDDPFLINTFRSELERWYINVMPNIRSHLVHKSRVLYNVWEEAVTILLGTSQSGLAFHAADQ